MKRLTPQQYARSVQQALAGGTTVERREIASRLVEALRRHRAVRLIPRILMEFRRLEATRAGRRIVNIEAADEEFADRLRGQFKRDDVSITINSELRRGGAVTIDDKRIEFSLAGALRNMRETLVSIPDVDSINV